MWTAKIDVLLLMFYLLFSYKLFSPQAFCSVIFSINLESNVKMFCNYTLIISQFACKRS